MSPYLLIQSFNKVGHGCGGDGRGSVVNGIKSAGFMGTK